MNYKTLVNNLYNLYTDLVQDRTNDNKTFDNRSMKINKHVNKKMMFKQIN